MGKLLDPDPGDVIDRVSILLLKILHAGPSQTIGWQDELTHLRTTYPLMLTDTLLNALGVAAINGCVWEREEWIRDNAKMENERVDWALCGEIAVKTRRLNDRKAEILRDLNGGRVEKLFL